MQSENIIRLLPDSVANQIAAGEVVQRPASAVKELLENAVDAKAKHIILDIHESGKKVIHIKDDGVGMSPVDARMSFERHATSKIHTGEDLFKINTKGFRGEALASIAAVAQVELKSKRESDKQGTSILIEGSDLIKQESIPWEKGTSIWVKNLFFNIPARRKFLKSDPVEWRHIQEEFIRVALAHADLNFTLVRDGDELFRLREGKLSRRIVDLFGKNYRDQLAVVEQETPMANIRGYIGKPKSAKKTRGDQYLMVNNRFIKHPYLHHAIKKAYDKLIPEDYHPFYVLFIDIDSSKVDINVSPSKTEAKFEDEHGLYAILAAAAKHALNKFNFTPSIDFDLSVDLNEAFIKAKPSALSEHFYRADEEAFMPKSKNNASGDSWENQQESFEEYTTPNAPWSTPLPNPFEQQATIPSSLNSTNNGEIDGSVVQLHNQFLLAQVKSGLLIIDQQAAHERVLFDQFVNNKRTQSSQQLLFPLPIIISKIQLEIIHELEGAIKNLGFNFTVKGERVFLTGVPLGIPTEHENNVLLDIIDAYKPNHDDDINLEFEERLALIMAKRVSIKPGTILKKEARESLFHRLFASSTPQYTPEGRTTMEIVSLEQLSNLFKN